MADLDKKTDIELKCHDCGASLHCVPGTTSLSCEYCGAKNEIEGVTVAGASAKEINLDEYLEPKRQDGFIKR